MAREWKKDPEGVIWCKDNGGPADCEYSNVRPAAMGSHQRYRHGIEGVGKVGPAPRRVHDLLVETPAGGEAEDVATLMGNMLTELRRLWKVEAEFEEYKKAYAVMRQAAERANEELRNRPRPKPTRPVTSTGLTMTADEARKLLNVG